MPKTLDQTELPTEVVPIPSASRLPATLSPDSGDVIALLRLAVERGVAVEALEKLVALQERYQDRQAQREFAAALADFQSQCPPIPKNSTATIVSEQKGTKFSYSYAELDTIAETVRPFLHALGLSYSWDSTVDSATINCTCTLRHRNGHSITARFAAPVDSAGRMSVTQRHASALSYARRQSLVQVLGLTTTEPDEDGAEDVGTITDEQQATLAALMEEVGADRGKFLNWLRVDSLASVRVAQYPAAIKALQQKRKQP